MTYVHEKQDADIVREALHDLYHHTPARDMPAGRSDIWQHGLAAISRLEARIAELERERDSYRMVAEANRDAYDSKREAAEARAERYAEALRRIDYGIEVDWALSVDENCERLREVARAALADQPPAENSG